MNNNTRSTITVKTICVHTLIIPSKKTKKFDGLMNWLLIFLSWRRMLQAIINSFCFPQVSTVVIQITILNNTTVDVLQIHFLKTKLKFPRKYIISIWSSSTLFRAPSSRDSFLPRHRTKRRIMIFFAYNWNFCYGSTNDEYCVIVVLVSDRSCRSEENDLFSVRREFYRRNKHKDTRLEWKSF